MYVIRAAANYKIYVCFVYSLSIGKRSFDFLQNINYNKIKYLRNCEAIGRYQEVYSPTYSDHEAFRH